MLVQLASESLKYSTVEPGYNEPLITKLVHGIIDNVLHPSNSKIVYN